MAGAGLSTWQLQAVELRLGQQLFSEAQVCLARLILFRGGGNQHSTSASPQPSLMVAAESWDCDLSRRLGASKARKEWEPTEHQLVRTEPLDCHPPNLTGTGCTC